MIGDKYESHWRYQVKKFACCRFGQTVKRWYENRWHMYSILNEEKKEKLAEVMTDLFHIGIILGVFLRDTWLSGKTKLSIV